MATLYLTSGEVKTVKPRKGKKFKLDELQEFVGGYIEIVPGSGLMAFCNEEGRLLNLPLNPTASVRYHQHLFGDVIVCDKGETS